jgi:hypothetical protein
VSAFRKDFDIGEDTILFRNLTIFPFFPRGEK